MEFRTGFPSAASQRILTSFFYNLKSKREAALFFIHSIRASIFIRPNPVQTLLELTRNKLSRLATLQPGHASTPATLEHWRRCEANLAGHVHTEGLTLTSMSIEVEGVPCPYCGVYFQHTKAMRQHARKHGVKWRETPASVPP